MTRRVPMIGAMVAGGRHEGVAPGRDDRRVPHMSFLRRQESREGVAPVPGGAPGRDDRRDVHAAGVPSRRAVRGDADRGPDGVSAVAAGRGGDVAPLRHRKARRACRRDDRVCRGDRRSPTCPTTRRACRRDRPRRIEYLHSSSIIIYYGWIKGDWVHRRTAAGMPAIPYALRSQSMGVEASPETPRYREPSAEHLISWIGLREGDPLLQGWFVSHFFAVLWRPMRFARSCIVSHGCVRMM